VPSRDVLRCYFLLVGVFLTVLSLEKELLIELTCYLLSEVCKVLTFLDLVLEGAATLPLPEVYLGRTTFKV
jgi:hypothetical protein